MTAPEDLVSCTECVRWLRDAGKDFERRPARVGLRIARPPGGMLPCARCAKVPPGAEPHPASAIEPSELSAKIFRHWEQCEAVRWQVPEATDPIVRRHAAIIGAVKAAVEEAKRLQMAALTALGSR